MERHDYIAGLLHAYRTTPGTTGVVRRGDRRIAEQLFERAVPLIAVRNAFVLASVRRLTRPSDAAPLPTIRSLAYFLPVLDEVLRSDAGADYYERLRSSLERRTRGR